jgi:hypothetical protein
MEEQKEISKVDDISVFNEVIDKLKNLDENNLSKIIKMLITYFDYKEKNSNERKSFFGDIETQSSFSEDRAMSPKEFILEKRPQTDVERVACLAYYLTHYRAQPHFKTLDISFLNTEAAQRKFSNAAKSVDNATSYGYLVQATKGMKQLSADGELYVRALPDRDAAREIMDKSRRRKRSKSTKSKLPIKEEVSS